MNVIDVSREVAVEVAERPPVVVDPPARERARLAVLAEIGLLLQSAGDHVTILHKLTELAVPALGDRCYFHVVGSRDALDPAVARAFATSRSDSGALPSGEAYLVVPMIVRARVIGVLSVARAAGAYDRDELEFAEELARRVAMFVDNAMLLAELEAREVAVREEAARLETLNRIGQRLAAIHDLDEVLQEVCDAAIALTGAELAVCFTCEGGELAYVLRGASYVESQIIERRRTRLLPRHPAFAAQKALRVDDVRRANTRHDLGAFVELRRVTSYLAVPVRGRRGELIGGIAVAHSRVAAFGVRAEQLVLGLASLAATATDSARLLREARELIEALEQSNRELDQFAQVASHDLRAPLRGIANLATWIEEDLGERMTERGREHLHLLHGRVRRLEDIVQGVLDYSRAGREHAEPVEVDTSALVHEIVELLAPARELEVIARELPKVRTPRVPLQQVLMNLISNAIKHGHTELPRIEIGCEPVADGWEFFVRDNGPGIPPRFHDQIWELFRTLQSRDRVDTAGIGLAIVRKIVEAHGGRAWVESTEGCGATFRFTWPRVCCTPHHAEAAARTRG